MAAIPGPLTFRREKETNDEKQEESKAEKLRWSGVDL
jgi:hypothetical protein